MSPRTLYRFEPRTTATLPLSTGTVPGENAGRLTSGLVATPDSTPIKAGTRRRQRARMTPAKLRAQRANAKRSTGPRTVEGRRRAAFNRLRLPLEYWMRRDLERGGRSLAELRRLWHDLAAIFWFVDPGERCFGVYWAACNWWEKLDALRRGNSSQARLFDTRIEDWLGSLLSRFARGRLRHWQRRVRTELGPEALRGSQALRMAVEARLAYFGTGLSSPRYSEIAQEGGPPRGSNSPSAAEAQIPGKSLNNDDLCGLCETSVRKRTQKGRNELSGAF